MSMIPLERARRDDRKSRPATFFQRGEYPLAGTNMARHFPLWKRGIEGDSRSTPNRTASPCDDNSRPLHVALGLVFFALLLLPFHPSVAKAAEPSAPTAPEKSVNPIPDFAELEKAHAFIGKIRIWPQNIFDLTDDKEDWWLFSLANKLHIQTKPKVIERLLLFKSGEQLSRQKIEETERILLSNRFLYAVVIRPTAYENNVVDIDVITRDTWTLDVTGSYSRSGGNNKTSFGLKDYNLLGNALRMGYARTSDADRKGNEFEVSYAQAFDGWTNIAYSQGRYDDGKRKLVSILHPFYSLDTRWAGGAIWSEDSRLDSLYKAGETIAQYRHRQNAAEISGGWSPGLVNGWTQRFTVGALSRDDHYAREPGKIAPALMPVSQDTRAPFVRYELIEDQYVKLRNRDQIYRPEFFSLGLLTRLQLARALTGWGSSQSAWLYSATVSNGFEDRAKRNTLVAANLVRRIASTGDTMTQTGGSVRFFAPIGAMSLFYASIGGDHVSGGGVADQLLIGGNSGLRGFPSRYQTGVNRAVATIEQRTYTDWYPFRLFRIGGAMFFDCGRAWGGLNQNTIRPGWLSDAGIGLRIAMDRAAFANVLHADIAVPLNRPAGIKPVQFLVKTELTF